MSITQRIELGSSTGSGRVVVVELYNDGVPEWSRIFERNDSRIALLFSSSTGTNISPCKLSDDLQPFIPVGSSNLVLLSRCLHGGLVTCEWFMKTDCFSPQIAVEVIGY